MYLIMLFLIYRFLMIKNVLRCLKVFGVSWRKLLLKMKINEFGFILSKFFLLNK